MTALKGFQKKYLRGLAHSMKPVVLIGQHGLTPAVMATVEEALNAHELIKVKFNDFKEKEDKEALSERMIAATRATAVGSIGHTLILYRQHRKPEKRRIKLPKAAKN